MVIPKGYKQTEVGVIPGAWECRKLGDIAQVKMCKRIFAEQTTENGEIPFYKIGTFGKCPDAYITRALYEEYRSRFSYPKEGDVLISAAGTLGRTVVFDGKDAYFQDSNIVWLDVDPHILSNRYLEHYYQVIKWASSEGSTISRLYNGIIRGTWIAVPPVEEQEKIAAALSVADVCVSSLEKLISKKKIIKQGTMQDLLTGRHRLPGFDGVWKMCSMDLFVGFLVGFPFHSQYFNTAGFGMRLIKNRDLKSDDQVYYTTETVSQEYVVHDGDILVGMDGDFIPCKWEKGTALLNQRVGKLTFKPTADGDFMFYILQKPLSELQDGTGATTVKHLSHGDVQKLTIKMPPSKEEQTAIAAVLSTMDQEIKMLEQKLVKYRQLKQGMMQQLLTGKIRLA